MRYAISLTRRAAFGVAAGTLAAGALLFSAGLLVGASTAAVAHESSALMPAHAAKSAPADSGQAAADSAAELPVFSAPAADCPPAAQAGTAPAARHRPAASPEPQGTLVAGRTVGTYRDEAHALSARQRYEAIGVEAFIEAWAGADGEPVFRVVAGRAP